MSRIPAPKALLFSLAALVMVWPALWQPAYRATDAAVAPAEHEVVWAVEDLPEGVPLNASPYDEETQPPPVVEPSPIIAPIQEIVQRVAAVASAPPAPPSAPARPWGAIQTEQVIANARSLLGVRYLWGGNTNAGMDCSAYVSRAWNIPRNSTDTLHNFGYAITKEELRAGDVLNLTRRQDPRGFGHVRLFERWANPQKTRMWVYEETPPRAVYHAIAYDPRYTPMRRNNYYPEETIEELVAAWAVPDVDPAAPVQRGLIAPPPAITRPNPTPTPQVRANPTATSRPATEETRGGGDRATPTRTPTAKPASPGVTITPIPAKPTMTPKPPEPTPTPALGLVQTAPPPPPPTAAPTEAPPPPTPTVVPTGPPPSAPIRLYGVPQSCRELLISWELAEPNASGFRVYRGGQFVGGINAGTRYYVDTSLSPSTTYSYTVTAWNAGGESAPSKPVEVKTKAVSATCR